MLILGVWGWLEALSHLSARFPQSRLSSTLHDAHMSRCLLVNLQLSAPVGKASETENIPLHILRFVLEARSALPSPLIWTVKQGSCFQLQKQGGSQAHSGTLFMTTMFSWEETLQQRVRRGGQGSEAFRMP